MVAIDLNQGLGGSTENYSCNHSKIIPRPNSKGEQLLCMNFDVLSIGSTQNAYLVQES